MASGRFILGLSALVLAVLVWSVIRPHDYETWALEVFPVFLGAAALWTTDRRLRLTRLAYVLIALHMIVLIIGGHYTYAEVPIGNWARDHFHFSRNHYDRVGHFVQGFVPAMIAREVLLRCTPLRRGWWLVALVLGFCMGVSACYELVEWGVAEVDSAGSQSFLGTQGDPWDTQEDMAMCGIGAICSLLLMSRVQDRQLRGIVPDKFGA